MELKINIWTLNTQAALLYQYIECVYYAVYFNILLFDLQCK